jgi:hypothetical protein
MDSKNQNPAMDSKNQDPAVDSKNQAPANGELKDSELAGVTGGTSDVVALSKAAAVAAIRGAADAEMHDRTGFGPILGGH